MSETALTIPPASMPALTIEQALQRRNQQNEFIAKVLRKDLDFGNIPGTKKPTLMKPGAEKLLMFFGLRPRFEALRTIEDWTGKEFGGEPFFYYHQKCILHRDGEIMAEGDGSCNSRETKYRYRQGERRCPKCGEPAIIKGKKDYGGGWLCFAKMGGCGAKFPDGDESIEGQQTGRVVNADIADQANTILKMAQKRALIAATLIGVNASEYFTQDLEDLPHPEAIEGEVRIIETGDQTRKPQAAAASTNTTTGRPATLSELMKHAASKNGLVGPASDPQIRAVVINFSELFEGKGGEDSRHFVLEQVFGVKSAKDLTRSQASAILDTLDKNKAEKAAWASSVYAAYQKGIGQNELPMDGVIEGECEELPA